MTSDGAFRVIAAVTTETVESAARTQGAAGVLAMRLGELLTGTILLRETMYPSRRVQIILQDEVGGRIVADSLPDGTNRGIINPGSEEPVKTAGDALLSVNYTLPGGKLHQGVVAVPADLSISTALMQYMQTSEQVVSMIAVLAQPGEPGEPPRGVAGFVVQLLPEAEHHTLAEMTEHLAGFAGLEALLERENPSPEALVEGILRGQEFEYLAQNEVCFGCGCSRERMLVGIGSLPKSDLQELIADGEAIEVCCESCGQRYDISLEELGALLLADAPGSGSGPTN